MACGGAVGGIFGFRHKLHGLPGTVPSGFQDSNVSVAFPARAAVHAEDAIEICVRYPDLAAALGMPTDVCNPPCRPYYSGRRLLQKGSASRVPRSACIPNRVNWALTDGRVFVAEGEERALRPNASDLAGWLSLFGRSACQAVMSSRACNVTRSYTFMCAEYEAIRNANGSCSAGSGAVWPWRSPEYVANPAICPARNGVEAFTIRAIVFGVLSAFNIGVCVFHAFDKR